MNDEDDKKDEVSEESEEETREQPEESPKEETEIEKPQEVPRPGEVVEPEEKPETSGREELTPAQQQQVDNLSEEELDKIVSQLKPDADGTVPLKEVVRALGQHNQEQARRTAREEVFSAMSEVEASKRAWEEAYETYPQLKDNPNLHKLVENQRVASIADGGNLSPKAAAEALFAEFKQAQAETTRQNQESVRVQQAAHLETASTQSDTGSEEDKLLVQSGDRDRARGSEARQALLKKWIADGKISIS